MPLRAMVFIDGNNFYHSVKATGIRPSHIDYQKLRDAICKIFNFEHAHTYWYNSVPSIADGAPLYYDHMKFMDTLRLIPNFTPKTRKLQRHSNKEKIEKNRLFVQGLNLCDVCQPLVETAVADSIGPYKKKEKGIDVMIATDMLNLSAIKKETPACILLSGDADFAPVMAIMHEYGIQVRSVSVVNGYSRELRQSFPYHILEKDFLIKNCLKTGVSLV